MSLSVAHSKVCKQHNAQDRQLPVTPTRGLEYRGRGGGRQPVLQAQMRVVQDLLCGKESGKAL